MTGSRVRQFGNTIFKLVGSAISALLVAVTCGLADARQVAARLAREVDHEIAQ
jgi:hypothetical protein